MFPPYENPPTTTLDHISEILMLGSGAGVVLFTVSYIAFFQWRRTGAGKAILYFALSLCALLGQIIATRSFGGDFVLRDIVRLVAYAVVFLSSWGLVFTLWRNWSRGAPPIELKQRTEPTRVIEDQKPSSGQ